MPISESPYSFFKSAISFAAIFLIFAALCTAASIGPTPAPKKNVTTAIPVVQKDQNLKNSTDRLPELPPKILPTTTANVDNKTETTTEEFIGVAFYSLGEKEGCDEGETRSLDDTCRPEAE